MAPNTAEPIEATSASTSTFGSASASASAAMNANTSMSVSNSLQLQQREVASGIANLGNTCYMNAVLQALAHAPELCLAMDCEPHHLNCPIAQENATKRRNCPLPSAEATESHSSKKQIKQVVAPQRKSRRSGKKSPTNGNGTNSSNGTTAANTDHSNNHASDNSAPVDKDALEFCALCEVEEHLARAHAEITESGDAVAPSTFVNGFISKVAPWFKLGVQEDSHEFLRLLIDAMQKSCTKARKDKQQDTQDKNRDMNQDTQPNDEKDDTEYPFKLFRGTVESNVTCDSCKAVSSKIDPIEDIGLEVIAANNSLFATHHKKTDNSNTSNHSTATTTTTARGRSKSPTASALSQLQVLTDVAGAFHRFIRDEPLDSGYKCDKCGKVGKATKQSRLASIPPILTLHLKRFRYGNMNTAAAAAAAAATSSDKYRNPTSNAGGAYNNGNTTIHHHPPALPPRRTGRSEVSQLMGISNNDFYGGSSGSAKIEGHVKYDQVFDILPFCQESLQLKHKNMYCRLFAVVVHAGKNSHSGHYIAYVRNVGKNEWWKMDDARVTRASAMEVMNAEAYMLFYRVVDHPIAVQLRNDHKARTDEAVATAAKAAAATKKKVEEEQKILQVHTENGETATTVDMNNGKGNTQSSTSPLSTVKNKNAIKVLPDLAKKKRKRPDLVTGEEWARAKTRLPTSFMSILKRAEEFVSENVEFKPDYFSLINEEASKGAKVGSRPTVGVSPGEISTMYCRMSCRSVCNVSQMNCLILVDSCFLHCPFFTFHMF